jgi:hypothetical protein
MKKHNFNVILIKKTLLKNTLQYSRYVLLLILPGQTNI